MLKNSKIETAIPGYTGYKPKNSQNKKVAEQPLRKSDFIPGYQGHIPKI